MNQYVSKYGQCSRCGCNLLADWFVEEEYETIKGNMYKTGRTRWAVNYLYCEICGNKEVVDDSFDGPWR